jgi:phosphatidylinositol 4-phosphatase
MQRSKGRVLKIYDSRSIFENLDTGNCLVVTQIKDGWSRDIQVCDKSQLADIGGCNTVLPIEAIFGFYDLLSGAYVAVVVESENFISSNGMDIRKALKIVVVPLFSTGRILSESKRKDEAEYLRLLNSGFALHNFFFSYSFDVTSTHQRLAKLSSRKLSEPVWVRANHKFFWNREVILDMIACHADDWIVPFMSAFIDIRPGCEIDNDKFSLFFISRRSRMRQGCRFTRRGIDEFGHAANYVETELVLMFPDGGVASHVQTRGSIPVSWASPVHMKYDPKVYIDEDRARSAEWCEKHVNDLVADCSDASGLCSIVFVNLIDGKKDQGKLVSEFKAVVEDVSNVCSVDLRYVWFDFHHECKQKGKWKNLSKLVTLLDDTLASHGFFWRMPDGDVKCWQKGVFRTNCMDNLDRTNVVQSIFARRAILMQLKRKDLLTGDNVLEIPQKKFEAIYKTIWANNANEMSRLYAGTGALKVDFTKTGKRTFTGMYNDGINSCMRYYINNFLDGAKQDSIDMILGNYHPDPAGPSPFSPSSGRETPMDNANKMFVLFILVFTFLLLITPKMGVLSQDSTNLLPHISVALCLSFAIAMYILYAVVIRGSKIGARLVVHPQLVNDPAVQKQRRG